ncbi:MULTISPECIES: DUF3813 domain-containing protein [Bacillus]|uniref:DUF3813 domain-containing protein n=1 Tax=Bacillus TaxID=1386 RepID=UPI000BB8BD7C|nr:MULTISPECIES: DUF3813 domain-containing protein [Bacillus]
MGNRLFQSAKEAVMNVIQHKSEHQSSYEQQDVEVAKNALSSAYANSTEAEQRQLREFQDQLEQSMHNNKE